MDVPFGKSRLARKPEAIQDWDSLSADEKKLFARQMEVFAGYGEYADFEIGRLIQATADHAADARVAALAEAADWIMQADTVR